MFSLFLRHESTFRYWDALKDLKNEDEDLGSGEAPEDTPAWVRCSAADLYYSKDPTVKFEYTISVHF